MAPGGEGGGLPFPATEPDDPEDEAPPGPPVVADVEALLAEVAARDADPWRIRRIAAEAARELTPQELRRLYQGVEALPDRERIQLFRQRAPLYPRLLRAEVPAFASLRLSTHARLFEAAGAAAAEKSLLVLFTGAVGGLFMPVVRLLVDLPVGRFDVLRLDAGPTGDYPGGVPGIGESLFAVCRAARELAGGYAGGAALGTSLGGYTALRAGRLAGLPVAVSIAGRFSRLERLWLARDAARASDVPAFDPLCPSLRATGTTLIAYHAAENRTDTRHAAQLARLCPEAWIRPVPRVESHNPIPMMLANGGFDAMLADLQRLSPRGRAA